MPLSDHQPVTSRIFCTACNAEVVPLLSQLSALAAGIFALACDLAKKPMVCPHCKAVDSLRAA